MKVLLIVNSCGHAPATVTSENPIVGVPSQLSVAVALPVTAVAVLVLHCTVILAGQVIVGGELSSTNMV